MSDPAWRPVPQWAEQLAQLLDRYAVPLAENTGRAPLDAATPEQVDLVYALGVLGRVLQDFGADAITQPMPSDQWARLAEALAWAARLCRQQVIIETDGQ